MTVFEALRETHDEQRRLLLGHQGLKFRRRGRLLRRHATNWGVSHSRCKQRRLDPTPCRE